MNSNEVTDMLIRVLRRIAPEADYAALDPGVELREQLDIDSMDFLNFIIGVHEATGIDIPEAHYAEMETLGGAAAYIERVQNAQVA